MTINPNTRRLTAMKSIAVILLIFCGQIGFSQVFHNQEWVATSLLPDTLDYSVAKTDYNNQLVVATHQMVTGNGSDMLLTKYNDHGGVEWQQYYNNDKNGNDFPVAMVIDKDEYIYITGVSFDSGSTTQSNWTTIKYSPDGVQQWVVNYIGQTNTTNSPTAIATDDNGNIYVAGSRYDSLTAYDFTTIKYDSAGTEEWVSYYDYAGLNDVPALIAFNSGNIVVSGGSASAYNNWDIVALSYDVNGALKDSVRSTVTGNGIDNPTAIKSDLAGNIYITGSVYDSATISNNIKTIKLDNNLAIHWEETYDAMGLSDVANSIDVDKDGNVYVGGYVTTDSTGKDFFIVKYDSTGTILWVKQENLDNISDQEVIKLQLADDDKSIYATGRIKGNTGSDMLIMKLTNNGMPIWRSVYKDDLLSNSIPDDLEVTDAGDVYLVGRQYSGFAAQTAIVKFTDWTKNTDFWYNDNGEPVCKKNEIIIRFEPSSLVPDAINNKEYQYYEMGTVVKADMLDTMANKLGISPYILSEQMVHKVYFNLNQFDTVQTDRFGNDIAIPDFYTTLLLVLDVDVDSPIIRFNSFVDSLNTIHPGIKYAEPNYAVDLLTNDTYWNDGGSGWNIPNALNVPPPNFNLHSISGLSPNYPNANINIEPAWSAEPNGAPNVAVGIFDSGLEYSNEDFGSGGIGASTNVVKEGWDYFNNVAYTNSTIVHDFNGHGTNVAGVIGAIANNSKGIAGVVGGNNAPAVKLYALGCNGLAGSSTYPLDLNKILMALGDATGTKFNNHKPLDIFNYSWSMGPRTYAITGTIGAVNDIKSLKGSIRFAFKNGIVNVAARGNYGIGSYTNPWYPGDGKEYPATYKNDWVLSVGASGNDGKFKMQANSLPACGCGSDDNYVSSWGRNVDCIAPGSFSIVPTTSNSLNGYTWFNGTSAAAPHVTGLAALLIAHSGNSFPLAPEDVEQLVKYGCDDETSGPVINYYNGPSNQYAIPMPDIGPDRRTGFGKINAGNSMGLISNDQHVVHFTKAISFTSTNGSERNATYATNQSVYIEDDFYQQGQSIIRPRGVYNLDIEEFTAQITHNLSSGAYIVENLTTASWKPGAWVLNSQSNLWGSTTTTAQLDDSQTGQSKYLLPETDIKLISYSITSATVKGYRYKSAGTSNYLYQESDKGGTNAILTYSLLVHDTHLSVMNNVTNDSAKIYVVPNPTQKDVTVYFYIKSTTPYMVRLLTIDGKNAIDRIQGQAQKGINAVTFDLNTAPAGVYFVEVTAGQFKQTAKLVKL